MGELTAEDDVAVTFHTTVSHGEPNCCDQEEEEEEERGEEPTERIHLRINRLGHDDDEEARRSESSQREGHLGTEEKATLCPPFCVRGAKLASSVTSAREGRRERESARTVKSPHLHFATI